MEPGSLVLHPPMNDKQWGRRGERGGGRGWGKGGGGVLGPHFWPEVNNLYSSFRFGGWGFFFLFFCASQTPLSCVQNTCPTPPHPTPDVSPPLAVALAARFSSSSAAFRVEPSVRMSTSVGRTSNARITSFFFLFTIISDHVSSHVTITSCGDGTLSPVQTPSSLMVCVCVYVGGWGVGGGYRGRSC